MGAKEVNLFRIQSKSIFSHFNFFCTNQSIDLIFLDIEMPYMTGLEFLSSIDNFQKVIIVSAYEQYALKGYEFNVVESMENYVIIHTSNSKKL
ncbi:LytR/AlgR family response regulator transcription factor [Chryseobacterium indoltheticum]|nr:response regulator [Chryseobacterium indoltheticum]